MRASPEARWQKAKKVVLDELERLGEDCHPRNQTLLARFIQCPHLQQSALVISRAVDAERHTHSATPLAPPPGWLPPLV